MQHTTVPSTQGQARAVPDRRWRVVDIVVASVVGVALGVVFLVWGAAYEGLSAPVKALLPGAQSFVEAPFLLGAVLGGLLIRKPGAAVYVELLAAVVSALLGSQWGLLTLVSGLVQGLGAEIVFAVFLYRVWRLPVAWLAGAGAGVGLAVFELVVYYPGSGALFATVFVVGAVLGGALIAGTLSWLAVRALARTGALHRFAAGRDTTELV
ncbi:energy-coupling factor transport system substrate-specific component [Friedmanniella luteola]|uniref:Energy-coupling factor transport system substrate-specific component n=1 Tax=Friedmanniella luteola TaxID=546871 RepID=A0A1H1S4S2_9ACTN|nr:ECF transporter S component [Friedmanniella luteola]SDS43100.1 energy-coupling factor transport system substrate-specific component [Friedmanniella luteola]